MSVNVCYNSRTLYTYTISSHVCDCLLQQSYTLYIYYKPSCLWLFVTTVVHFIHILQAVMSVIVCYNSRTLYTYTISRHVCDCLLQQSYTVYIYYKPSCLWLFVTAVVFYTYPELLLVHTRTNVAGSFPPSPHLARCTYSPKYYTLVVFVWDEHQGLSIRKELWT